MEEVVSQQQVVVTCEKVPYVDLRTVQCTLYSASNLTEGNRGKVFQMKSIPPFTTDTNARLPLCGKASCQDSGVKSQDSRLGKHDWLLDTSSVTMNNQASHESIWLAKSYQYSTIILKAIPNFRLPHEWLTHWIAVQKWVDAPLQKQITRKELERSFLRRTHCISLPISSCFRYW